jgi:modified peptide precursor CbpA
VWRPGKEVIRMKHQKKAVIAFRKVCKAKGTGLSYYILMAGKEK